MIDFKKENIELIQENILLRKQIKEMKYSPTQGYGVSCYKSNFS
jgi:hypothetical protein